MKTTIMLICLLALPAFGQEPTVAVSPKTLSEAVQAGRTPVVLESSGRLAESLTLDHQDVDCDGHTLILSSGAEIAGPGRLLRCNVVRMGQPVIWAYSGERDEPASLQTALRSGRISHVAIFAGNRVTSDTLDKPETREAIALAAASPGIRLILIRFLFETQPSDRTAVTVLTDPDFYATEIRRLRQEATALGADSYGFDIEAYGPTPIREFFRNGPFSETQYGAYTVAVQLAVEREGQVDYVLPCGSYKSNHPYQALAGLGATRITESTYYDRTDTPETFHGDWQMPGLYVNTTKANPTHEYLQYYLASEVFSEKAGPWKEHDGVFIWPRENRALDVAKTLANEP